MRTVLQALRELLEPRILHEGALELRESDPGSTCSPTKLDRSGQCVALRFEPWGYRRDLEIPTNRWLFPLFDVKRGDPPLCRSCDYIIFYAPADDTKLFVFMCELKSGSPKGSLQQVRNGLLLARYILDVVKLHGAVHQWPDVKFRGIIFTGNNPSVRGGLRGSASPQYQQDDVLKDLYTMVERSGGRHHLQTLCV